MTANFDTGHVHLKLSIDQGKVGALEVSSERPSVAGVLRGRSKEQALQLIPLMFSLCGKAQTAASTLAINAAHAEIIEPYVNVRVHEEAIREHLWRCLLDLPKLLGAPVLQQQFLQATKLIADENRIGLTDLFRTEEVAMLRHRLAQVVDGTTYYDAFLPTIDAATSLSIWPRLTDRMSVHPDWRGAAVMTGPLARSKQKSADSFFATHWLARFEEISNWANDETQIGGVGSVSSVQVAPNIGRALVETARGLLMHEVIVEKGQIFDYTIVAPTEWNFHPQSKWRSQVVGQDAQDRKEFLRQLEGLMITLDPCVPYEVEWL